MRASYKTSLIVLTWTLFLLKDLECQAASVKISVIPTDGKTTLGGLVTVQCSLIGASSNVSLLWYRRQGDIRYKFGSDNVLTLNYGDVGNKRYGLEQMEAKDTIRTYKLTMTDAQLEDSATFQCHLSTDSSAEAAVSVCYETSSQLCDCIATKGWASPDCFTSQLKPEDAASVESSWKQVVGLIIALCVIVAYSVVLILVGKRNFLHQCCTMEPLEDERKLNAKPDHDDSDRGQMDPSDSASDSATCSTSDPSSSGGSDAQGSNQSVPSSQSSTHRLVSDQTAEQKQWNRNQRAHKNTETSFVIKPEVHYNQGYNAKKDGEGHPQALGNQESNIGYQQKYQADVLPPYHSTSSLSGHEATGGQPETPFQHDLGNRLSPQPKRNQSRTNPVSGSRVTYADSSQRSNNDTYSSQVLNPYTSYNSLDGAGTEI